MAPCPNASCRGPDPRDRRCCYQPPAGLVEAYQRLQLPTGHARGLPALPPGPALPGLAPRAPSHSSKGITCHFLEVPWGSGEVLPGGGGSRPPIPFLTVIQGNLLRLSENHPSDYSRDGSCRVNAPVTEGQSCVTLPARSPPKRGLHTRCLEQPGVDGKLKGGCQGWGRKEWGLVGLL